MQMPIRSVAVTLMLALTSSEAQCQDAAGPRLGKYLIYSYGRSNAPPLYLGYFVLEKGGAYKVFLPGDRQSGEGTYEYDSAKKSIIWKTGTYEKEKWTGDFTTEHQGRTHRIQMKSTTIAKNSTSDDPK